MKGLFIFKSSYRFPNVTFHFYYFFLLETVYNFYISGIFYNLTFTKFVLKLNAHQLDRISCTA